MVNHPRRSKKARNRTPSSAKYAKAFNEWMRRFTQAPEEFSNTFESAANFLRAKNEGREPTYGEVASAYFKELLATV